MSTETAAPAAHSSLVGGSTAGRRLACPASYQYEQKVPEAVRNKSSSYAAEGTALHAAMAHILENDIFDAMDVVGMAFEAGPGEDEIVITEEQARDALQPCIDFFDSVIERMEAENAGPVGWAIEQRVEMPGIPDAFGTCDLIIYSRIRTVIADWKFGVGVPVKAVYVEQDDEGEIERLNPQLCYYGRGAMHTNPAWFGGMSVKDNDWPITLAIIQPRARVDDDEDPDNGRITTVDTTPAELEEFRMALVAAVSEATGKAPRSSRGDHCKFAACKTVCPLWTGPALDFTKLQQAAEARKATPLGDVFDYGDYLAAALALKQVVEPFFAEIGKHAHEYMESGAKVDGWKLVGKRAMRQWKDEAEALDTLRGVLDEKDLFTTKMQSPAQIEKTLKAMKQTLPGELVVSVSSGTTIAPEDDKRAEAVPRGVIVENFAKKLAAIMPAET